MIAHVIAAIIGNYLTSVFVLGLIIAGIRVGRVGRLGRPRTAADVSATFLSTYLLYAIGIGQILNFVMHSFFGDYAAKTIGWAQSPFQLELAFASLGLGVAAILVHGKRTDLTGKLGVVLMSAIFGYGAAGGHIYQLLVHHDHAVNNGGLLLIMDVVISTVGLLFVTWNAFARRADAAKRNSRTTDVRLAAAAAHSAH
jgi:hypothetical protein